MNTPGTGPLRTDDHRPASVSPPRLGILDSHPIQYHTPLYQRLSARGRVRPTVLYLHDYGLRRIVDPEFGVPIAWNIDLLSGYRHDFLAAGPGTGRFRRAEQLTTWIKTCDVVVIHGHSDPWMLFAATACHRLGIPYLLRGDSGPHGQSRGPRRAIRYGVARAVVAGSAGGLAVGRLNAEFYQKFRARSIVFAPHSVDNERFADGGSVGRAELLAQWGLDGELPIIMFCGKLNAAKRPLDLAAAISRIGESVTTIFVGDGLLAGAVRATLAQARAVVTGFVNQAELPSYYHAADILVLPSEAEPWGLVVNEAMATGTLPIVSDRVGAAPDLVKGIGEIYPCGDINALVAALRRGLARLADPHLGDQVRARVARYGVEFTAVGFEQAALAATSSQ
jgi:glycosyltransferase involved in cell wall biosynthesis